MFRENEYRKDEHNFLIDFEIYIRTYVICLFTNCTRYMLTTYSRQIDKVLVLTRKKFN